MLNSRAPFLSSSSPVFRDDWVSVPSTSPQSRLPSTSDAFALFPDRGRFGPGIPPHSSPTDHTPSMPASSLHESAAEFNQLRSSAFWELQRTIAENGEGMVSRMRDWEENHSQSFLRPVAPDQQSVDQASRIRSRSFDWADTVETLNDDEDDIQIVQAGPSSEQSVTQERVLARDMDIDRLDDDGAFLGAAFGDICSSPTDNSSCLSSGYASDEDPPGSLVFTNSSNSSRASLPLSHLTPGTASKGSLPLFDVPSTASPSEKAIAALTLVMANGAGGLNDYEAVRSLEAPHVSSLDDSLVGEMWD